MSDEDILTEYIKELGCDPDNEELRAFIYNSAMFKHYILGVRWTELKSQIFESINKLITKCAKT